jgi:hypothetical protein
MACAIVSGYALDCKDAVGGIKNIYITERTNLTAITENASGYVTAITKTGGKRFYLYALEPRGANSTSQTINADPTIGTVSVEQNINAAFVKMKYETQDKLQNVIQNRVAVIVEMKTGQYFLFGKDYGMQVNGGTGTSGQAMSEFNGYAITFQGEEKLFANEVDPSIIAALLV